MYQCIAFCVFMAITMAVAAAAGNTGSIGCGKELSAIKSVTHTLTSAGLNRKYIINVPANYDKNKP
jgi:poly(3-hydroxybutyrate) depolymerase